MSQSTTNSKIFLLGLIGLSVFACFLIFRSFIGEILAATILVTTFYRPFLYLVDRLRGRRMLASFLTCALIILIVIFPLANFLGYSAQRLVSAYDEADQYFNQETFYTAVDKMAANPLLASAMDIMGAEQEPREYLLQRADDLKNWLQSGQGNGMIIESSQKILAGTANTIVSIIIVIFCMFFFFVDGEKMLKKLAYWTPLSSRHDRAIFKKFKDVSFGVLLSTFITALVQGVLGAIGFLIVGFPVFFPAVSMALMSIVPYVGTAAVWAPISLYLLFSGQIWQGIFLIIWGALIIGNSDNLLKAYLLKDKAEVHPLFVFFSILGGLSLFGFWGIIYGPLIISLVVTVFHIYEIEFGDELEN